MSEIQLVADFLTAAKTPEEVFGQLSGSATEMLEAAKMIYRQTHLTELLYKCSPVYSRWPKDGHMFLDRLQHELRAPVALESWGPTAMEKMLKCTALA